jgi:hypothetical protein
MLAADDRMGGVGFVVAWIVPQMLGLLLGPPLVVAGMVRAGMLPPWALVVPVALVVLSVASGSRQWVPFVAFAVYGALAWWIALVVRRSVAAAGQ